jgi:hypothetical protein
LDLQSVDELVPSFTATYGPATRFFAPESPGTDPISIDTIVGWVRGNDALDLTLTSAKGNVLNANPSLSKGRAELKFIVVTLYGQKQVGGK